MSMLSVSFLSQPEERAQFEILKAQMFAERAAKRERRTKRARAMPEDEPPQKGQKRDEVLQKHTATLTRTCRTIDPAELFLFAAAKQKAGKRGKKSVFDEELTNTSRKSLKHYRAG